MKLLLHTCCAPCLIYPLERLREGQFDVTAFFYNPNVHPYAEYEARAQALDGYVSGASCKVIFPHYGPEDFFRMVNLLEDSQERCRLCWALRLTKTARAAREKGFGAFTTTLLVSPYQDQALLKRLGSEIGAQEGVEFYYEDFRAGFRKAHQIAHARGIYCQKYCGCIYSEIERHTKSKSRWTRAESEGR